MPPSPPPSLTDTLHHGLGPRVTHTEALGSHPADVRLALGGAVQRHVADDDVLLRLEDGVLQVEGREFGGDEGLRFEGLKTELYKEGEKRAGGMRQGLTTV